MKDEKTFWDTKYRNNDTGWDIGYVSTPIKEYIDQLTDKTVKILIPGGGNSYEAEYLFNNGFKNVYVVDISPIPLENFKKRVPSFPQENLLNLDFFNLNETYDLILEQTFFCALNPNLREAYVDKMHSLLRPNGRLVGLLFTFPLTEDGPPFGGNKTAYQKLFSKRFIIKTMEVAYNSIPPRQGNELFINLKKR
ncbi:MAG: SAM-dependent methyltransferase [Aequorivita sp.]|nr:SAM-dependent methyltransferase [Aequorivita sp.]|tara:strand:- start:152831 stop:153412 length:582 start_codon:yes stop_codon:yes gene_type:complete